jgi:hypothetical protein
MTVCPRDFSILHSFTTFWVKAQALYSGMLIVCGTPKMWKRISYTRKRYDRHHTATPFIAAPPLDHRMSVFLAENRILIPRAIIVGMMNAMRRFPVTFRVAFV